MAHSGELSVSVGAGVALVEIRRAPNNHFDERLIGELVEATGTLGEDPGCRVIVLASQGRHFCAGADFATADFAGDPASAAGRLYRRAAPLFEVRVPMIAAVQGTAVGGGLGLACVADFRVAEAATRFVANFARLGFPQGFGLSVTLPRLVGPQLAGDMLLTGRRVGGEEAVAAGLADRLAAPGTVRETAMEWARSFAVAAPLAVRSMRESLRGDLPQRARAAMEHELAEQAKLWQTRDSAEGIAASLQRREPIFRGE
ncbi:enoyl-CoA hydratase/isomerase family protein [Winogradskya consettensis]|uniref:Enoyl-CoA hydratase n=1 Tax=Winogradskya consettensis TaxID=113560 RepID=A0A919SIG7_9ACTN|nr:enoyl-CoA hydratase/isomerase family protein [Actinoplanes consettensis]GIM73027.1 enoyl-CoA hydratase [Actinoplanes consettensis]